MNQDSGTENKPNEPQPSPETPPAEPKSQKAWHLGNPVTLSFNKLVIFALVFMAIGGYAIYKSFAAELEVPLEPETVSSLTPAKTTVTVLNLVNEQKKVPEQKKSEVKKRLEDFAKVRKEVVQKAIESNPEAAIEATLPAAVVSQLPASLQPSVEKPVQIKGKFEHQHYDSPHLDKSLDKFFVTDQASKKRYQVHLTDKALKIGKGGDTVSLNGVELDGQVAADNLKVESSVQAAATTPIIKKAAVILLNFQNNKGTPYSQSSALSAYFTGSRSVNAFYNENSFGKIKFAGKVNPAGDVYGVYTIPMNDSNCSSNLGQWGAAADAQAQAAGVDLSGYDIITYLMPIPTDFCWFGGFGQVGGTAPIRSYVFGNELQLLIHEIGHNMGAWHSGHWTCTDGKGNYVAISADVNCTELDSGSDPFSIMSSTNIRHFNNYQKSKPGIGWLDPSNIQTLERNSQPSGTYTIAPLELPTAAVQALRVPKTVGPDGQVSDFYYLEFRQSYGFDSGIGSPASGVSIRIAPTAEVFRTGIVESLLLDANPSTPVDFSDAPLKTGQTFTDPDKGIIITTVSVGSSGAVVRVSFGSAVCTRANPSFSMSPDSASIYAGQSAIFSYTLKNNDSNVCPTSNFNLTNLSGSTFSQTPSQLSVTLAPGEATSGTLILTTPANATANTYTVNEQVTNSSVVGYTAYAYANFVVLPPVLPPPTPTGGTTPPPTTSSGPDVTIKEPKAGQKLPGGDFNIKATASDASGIAKITLFIDGRVVNTCYYVTTCTGKVKGHTLDKGQHTITATATNNGTPLSSTSTATISANK